MADHFLNATTVLPGENTATVILVLTREEVDLIATILEKLAKRVQSELERPRKASRENKRKTVSR